MKNIFTRSVSNDITEWYPTDAYRKGYSSTFTAIVNLVKFYWMEEKLGRRS